MIKKKLKIAVDFDDVLASCSEHAIDMHYRETGEMLDYSSINDWGYLGLPVDARMAYFQKEEFYETQPAYREAADFLLDLMKMAEVFICTAVYPQFMGLRIQRILKLFPFFPQENILMGKRKDIIHADIMLDDAAHNLDSCSASYPVLLRRPWNRHVSGIASVRNYQEFLALVNTLSGNIKPINKKPKIICILGPSGSGKNEFARELCSYQGFERVKTYSNRITDRYIHQNEDVLEKEKRFFESSYYCGNIYASSNEAVQEALDRGNNVVLVMDVNGCMAMRAAFPGQVVICYKKASRRDCVRNTLAKISAGVTMDQITDRICNIEYEEKHAVIADLVIEDNDCSEIGDFL